MDQLKTAFDHIRAEEILKAGTLAYIEKHRRSRWTRQITGAVACCLVLLLGSAWLYFTPTARISIDMDTPLTLEINRFDRVVSAGGSGSQAIPSNLELIHLTYSEAMEQILSSDTVSSLLDEGEIMAVSVIAPEAEQSDRLMMETYACTDDHNNTHCYSVDPETVTDAEHMGLSWGKYRAWLELRQLDPGVTAEEVRAMTLRQIRERIDALSQTEPLPTEAPSFPTAEPATEPTIEPTEVPTSPGHHGQGNGNGHSHGRQ